MFQSKSRIKSDLKSIKLSIAFLFAFLFATLPVLVSQINDVKRSQDSRSSAQTSEDIIGPIQSWVISPNGNEIVYGNTEVQFFARNAADENAKFSFHLELLKGNESIKTLFSIGKDDVIAQRDGIRSLYYDFTGFVDSTDYKLKLTTTDSSGQNVIEDYSDNFFTISSNISKPEFTSSPPRTSLKTGEVFEYNITTTDTSSVQVLGTYLPDWLTLQNNRLAGIASTPGIYSVVLTAANTNGRQSTQAFSLNVEAAPTPVVIVESEPNAVPTIPAEGAKSTTNTPVQRASSSKVNLPNSGKFSKTDTKITLDIPDDVFEQISNIIVEISRDGVNWESVYTGKSKEFNLDISKYEGGNYFLRVIYEFKDGTREIKNLGPIEIIKQDNNSDVISIQIKDITPAEGAKIEDRKPTISATFLKPAGSIVDLKKFKLVLDQNDISTNSSLKVNVLGFSYTPDSDLPYGKHEVSVSIGLENSESIEKTWSFEILDPENISTNVTEEQQNIFTKNKVLLSIVVGIIVLIFILAVWAIALSKKEKHYYTEEQTIVE